MLRRMRGCFLIVVLAACGGGSSSPLAGEQITSIASTKKIGELSRADQQRLCEDFKRFQDKVAPSDDDQRKMKCTFEAAFASLQSADDRAAQTACRVTRDECIAKKEPVEKPQMDCTSSEVLAKMAECPELTIAEMTECVKDMGDVMKKFATVDLCGSLKANSNESISKFFDQMKSAKCEALEARCKPAKDQAAGDKFHAEALSKVEAFQREMCACKDKACADRVNQAFKTWGTEASKSAPEAKPDPAVAKQTTELVIKYTECLTTLEVAAEGSGSAKQ